MFADLFSFGGEGGQVYVKVAADDSMGDVSMMSASGSGGGAGVVGAPFVIKWKFDGGIIQKTWEVNGIEIPHAVYNEEAINSAIKEALPKDFTNLFNELGRLGVGTCVVNG